MEKKVPKIFANKIDKKIENNSSYAVTKNDEIRSVSSKPSNIRLKINEIFKSNNYVYKADLVITLRDQTIRKRIIGRNRDSLITIDNEIISINDIIDIEYD